MADRWVLAQFSVENGFSQCVAVSTSPDATGTYHRYEFQYENFDDYPKMGVWPDGYYTSFNMFHGNDFAGSKACAYERSAMLAGQPARQQCFQLSDQFFGLLPSDLDGATSSLNGSGGAPGSAAPAAGTPNFFLALGSAPNTLDLWNFHVDWSAPAQSTFGVGTNHTPNQSIPVAAFTFTCGGSGGTCVPQPGTPKPEQLDTLGERLMYRLSYRRFADHEGGCWHRTRSIPALPTLRPAFGGTNCAGQAAGRSRYSKRVPMLPARTTGGWEASAWTWGRYCDGIQYFRLHFSRSAVCRAASGRSAG